MSKPKKVRGSSGLKALAFLLALVMAVATCASAGAAFWMYEANLWHQNGNDNRELAREQADVLPLYLFLFLHRSALTEDGQEAYEALRSEFLRSKTNFRYSIYLDGADDAILSNSAEWPLFEQEDVSPMGMDLFNAYELGYNRMISYYLNVNKAYDWELRFGTPQRWSLTENASAYYYNEDEVFLSEEETATLVTETLSGVDFYDEYDVDDIEPEAYDEEAYPEERTNYCYFVYTGSFPVYRIEYGVDTTYPVSDVYAQNAEEGDSYGQYYSGHMMITLGIVAACLAVFALLLIYLTLAIGWNREGELALRGLNRLPMEVVLMGTFLVELLAAVIFSDIYWDDYSNSNLLRWVIVFGLAGIPGTLGALTLWLVAAAQIKTRTILRRSLVCRLLRAIYRGIRKLAGGAKRMAAQWPLYDKVGIFCLIYWAVYLLYLGVIALDAIWEYGVWGLILFGTLPLVPLAVFVCQWALDWAKLRKAVQKMVAGQLDYTIDTSRMLPDIRQHGNDLSNLSAGLSKAVEERLKSERFKTELITNVSHDLKTPLTSIINYVDLLKQLDIQDETARGYIEVLDRKSQRLKTLTEDLVEASKAASGTLAVQMERLDVRELVEQAVAEYDERLEQAGLTTVVGTPEQPCIVMADGRHLWRVLDNLLGNCTKYAMPGTRVYLDVEEMLNRCVITVKNISADPLNIPAEDLLKRFVRGDSSRSTEGSGLGLSIARNLTTAQNGTFDLVVDGDLFKAIIAFPLAKPEAEQPAREEPVQPELQEPILDMPDLADDGRQSSETDHV